MKRFLYLICLISVLGNMNAFSQENKKNAVIFSVGGVGGLYSLGYERVFDDRFFCGVGGSFFSITEKGTRKNLQLYTLPVSGGLMWKMSAHKHFLEVGASVVPTVLSSTMNSFVRETDVYMNLYLILGYRLQTDSWLFRLHFTPFYGTCSMNDQRTHQQAFSLTGKGIQFWGGLAVGYRF